MPCSVPKNRTPANAAIAQVNSSVRILWIAMNSAGLIRPTEYTMTTASASIYRGSCPRNGAKTSMVAAAAAAVTSEAICVLPPTERTTAVCDVPPPDGIAPNKAPPRCPGAGRHELPGWRGDRGSPGVANACPAAIVSATRPGRCQGPPAATVPPGRSSATSTRAALATWSRLLRRQTQAG